VKRNCKFSGRRVKREKALISQHSNHPLFLWLTPRLALLGFVLCMCETVVFSLQQSAEPKEMSATIQTYWPRSQFTLRMESNLVEVGVAVRDRRGRAIGGLGKDDFEIEDAGRKREITAFSIETFDPIGSGAAKPPAPRAAEPIPENKEPRLRFVALLFDDFSMPFSQQVYVKAAARRFLRECLAQGDRVGLFTTSGRQIVPFTSDTAKLAAAVDRYSSFPRTPSGGICPKLTPYDAYVIANKLDFETYQIKTAEMEQCFAQKRSVTTIHPGKAGSWPFPGTSPVMMQAEAMWQQIRDTSARALDTMGKLVDYMRQLPGTRMIMMASSGFLTGSLEREQEKVVSHALRSEVVINALDAKGLYTEEPPELSRGADPRSLMYMMSLGSRENDYSNDVMAFLTRSTGGLFFDNNNDLDLGFRELGMVPEVSYLLGFSPEESPDGKYHDIRVRIKSPNQYLIQARPGYWAFPKQQESPIQERRIDRAVMGSDTLSELPARITSAASKTGSGDPALDAVLHLDAGQFHFLEKDSVRTQRLVFIAALFDNAGNFVAGKEAEIRFALKESTYKSMIETGVDMSLTLEAPPGTYRLRGVVQDAIDDKIVASTLPVQIR
jgi:VWFA-related protein